MRRAIVVGASSGIGKEVSRVLAAEGYQLMLLARNEKALQDLCAEITAKYGPLAAAYRVHDVTQVGTTPALFEEILHHFGNLDLVVYNAGVQMPTRPDEYNTDADLTTLDINLRGALPWLNAAATFFARKQSGAICAIGSVAGDRGRRGYPAYHASKAGLATFMESLWIRLSPLGVKVVTIKPGPTATPMTEGRDDIKGGLYPVEKAAAEIVAAIHAGKRVAYVPGKWAIIMLIIKHIPALLFRKLPI